MQSSSVKHRQSEWRVSARLRIASSKTACVLVHMKSSTISMICRQAVEELLEDHQELKTHFQRNLETVSAAMDDVVELQSSYSKLAEMQSEQAELKDMVDTLRRLLDQREREVERLSMQLQEVSVLPAPDLLVDC